MKSIDPHGRYGPFGPWVAVLDRRPIFGNQWAASIQLGLSGWYYSAPVIAYGQYVARHLHT